MEKKYCFELNRKDAELHLIFASATGNFALVDHLLKAGVDPSLQDELPYRLARMGDHRETADTLCRETMKRFIEAEKARGAGFPPEGRPS